MDDAKKALITTIIPINLNQIHTLMTPYEQNQPQTMDITSHLLDVQDRVINTLYCIENQCSTECYMKGLKTCTGDDSDEFTSWLLSVVKFLKQA